MKAPPYDAVIVGASIAGCTAAVLLARLGFRVALVERDRNVAAYKRLCTHYIQASAAPTIDRLGLSTVLGETAGVRAGLQVWTPWGWIRPEYQGDTRPLGLNVRRQTMDPRLRGLAVGTRGVEYFPGATVSKVLVDGARVAGLEIRSNRSTRELPAVLTIGADGRYSQVATLSRLFARVQANDRFVSFAYFRIPGRASTRTATMWFAERDVGYAFDTDGDSTLVSCTLTKAKLASFKADKAGMFRCFFEALPSSPDLRSSEQLSPFFNIFDMPSISRRVSRPGVALVGDAALASDPLWGVGCGWAFQSAEWLVDLAASALQSGDGRRVDRALDAYRRKHWRRLAAHHLLISDFATGRPYRWLERKLFAAAARDPVVARRFDAFGARLIGIEKLLTPAMVARMIWTGWRQSARQA